MNFLEANEAQVQAEHHKPEFAAHDHNHDHHIQIPKRIVTTVTQLENETSDESIELTGCAGSWFCNPTAWGHRIIAICLMCMLGFGSYFCYDNPGALIVSCRQKVALES